MKKIVVLSVLLTLVVMGLSAQTDEVVEKYWERGCGVDNTSDDVRNMAVSPEGDILATINRNSGSDAIQLFNATTGLMEEITEHLDMTGIPATTYSVVSGDFSDDGAFFACSLSYTTGVDLEVYYWANLTAAPVKILDQAYSTRLGDAFDATGQVNDNSITLLISGNTAGSVPSVLPTMVQPGPPQLLPMQSGRRISIRLPVENFMQPMQVATSFVTTPMDRSMQPW